MPLPWKLLPADPVPEFDLDNRVKLEYYHLKKTYECAIKLDEISGEWKPTEPHKAGSKKERLTPLDEIIEKSTKNSLGILLIQTMLSLIPCTTK